MSKGVRDFSVIDLKTPLSVNGKLVVVIHPLRLGLVNEKIPVFCNKTPQRALEREIAGIFIVRRG